MSKAGDLRRTSVTLAEVLKNFGVHARDVLSLGLQVRGACVASSRFDGRGGGGAETMAS